MPFGLFAMAWGISIIAGHLAFQVADRTTAVSLVLTYLVTLVILPPLLLRFAAAQQAPGLGRIASSASFMGAMAIAGVTLLLLLVSPTQIIRGVIAVDLDENPATMEAFDADWGPLYAPLVILPYFAGLILALVALMTAKAAAPTPRTVVRAGTLAAGLGLFVGFTAGNNLVFWLFYSADDLATTNLLFLLASLGLSAAVVWIMADSVLRLRRERTPMGSRAERATLAAIGVSFVWGSVEAILNFGPYPELNTVGLWRLAGVAIIAYGFARWRIFDLPQKTERAAATTAGVAGSVGAGAATYGAVSLLAAGPLFPAVAGVAVVGATLIPGVKVAKRILYTMKRQSPEQVEEAIYGQRIETYRAALEASIARGTLEQDKAFLEALRERFGITEGEDRILRYYARSAVLIPREGDLSSHYERLRLLGEGGGGRTWLARDRVHDRLVVLKEALGRWQSEPALRESMLREARLAARVRHPNVVSVEEVIDHQGQLLIVMEYLEGGSLNDLLRSRGNIPWPQAQKLVTEVLNGLEAVHAQGIVHRDIKPSNILLTGEGVAKIADFGIAIPASSAANGKTMVDPGAMGTTLAGTLAYMPPETRSGASVGDRRADVYACAALLHECLYGAPPVPGAVLITQPDVPAALVQAIHRGLAPDPAARYPTARAFAEDLMKVRKP
ncbi:MAG TPA: serine/threonine-protein kinase [Candidatus Thermoplasmatota archaeon]|nr:serine/threonine-protein kinase [Candidatus Thermoplasmatota archaeon]